MAGRHAALGRGVQRREKDGPQEQRHRRAGHPPLPLALRTEAESRTRDSVGWKSRLRNGISLASRVIAR